MNTSKYKLDITKYLDSASRSNIAITNKQWFKESKDYNRILQETKWVNELNPKLSANARMILIRDNITEFKKCIHCDVSIKFNNTINKTANFCSKSCVAKSTLDSRVIKRRENSKDKRCISKKLLKYHLECYDYELKNNKPYNKRMWSRLLTNYLWFEYKNLDLVTKCLLRYSKQRIFNIITNDLAFLITEYEKEYQLYFNSSDKYRILKFEKEPRLCKHCSNKVLTDNIFCSVKCTNRFKSTDEIYIKNLSDSQKQYYKTTDEAVIKQRHNKISNSLIQYNRNNIEEIISKNIISWGYNYPQEHPDIVKKSKRTRLEKYGNENYTNREPARHKEIMEKMKEGLLIAIPNSGVKTFELIVE